MLNGVVGDLQVLGIGVGEHGAALGHDGPGKAGSATTNGIDVRREALLVSTTEIEAVDRSLERPESPAAVLLCVDGDNCTVVHGLVAAPCERGNRGVPVRGDCAVTTEGTAVEDRSRDRVRSLESAWANTLQLDWGVEDHVLEVRTTRVHPRVGRCRQAGIHDDQVVSGAGRCGIDGILNSVVGDGRQRVGWGKPMAGLSRGVVEVVVRADLVDVGVVRRRSGGRRDIAPGEVVDPGHVGQLHADPAATHESCRRVAATEVRGCRSGGLPHVYGSIGVRNGSDCVAAGETAGGEGARVCEGTEAGVARRLDDHGSRVCRHSPHPDEALWSGSRAASGLEDETRSIDRAVGQGERRALRGPQRRRIPICVVAEGQYRGSLVGVGAQRSLPAEHDLTPVRAEGKGVDSVEVVQHSERRERRRRAAADDMERQTADGLAPVRGRDRQLVRAWSDRCGNRDGDRGIDPRGCDAEACAVEGDCPGALCCTESETLNRQCPIRSRESDVWPVDRE